MEEDSTKSILPPRGKSAIHLRAAHGFISLATATQASPPGVDRYRISSVPEIDEQIQDAARLLRGTAPPGRSDLSNTTGACP